MSEFEFKLLHVDGATGARRASLRTPHGEIQLPAFMPVGTQASVKGLTTRVLREAGTQVLLGNTYHLALRPGADVVAACGGLHQFMGWDGPILTDSGGFQLFSLASQAKVEEHGATFRSHIDGRLLRLSPEQAIATQEQLGSDIAMVLDHVTPLPSGPDVVRDACERTVRWARRSREAATRSDQAVFAIVQGGLEPELRVGCAEELVALDFPGYAIGGLSVGEAISDMYRMLEVTCPVLPTDRPRYLMGVGRPVDLLNAVMRGVDMFDCVMPTRNGRNALAFSDDGPLRMRNKVHQRDTRPIDESCSCPACGHSRAYLRHLFMAGEMLGPILLSAHNVAYYHRLLAETREAIENDRFETYFAERLQRWGEMGDSL